MKTRNLVFAALGGAMAFVLMKLTAFPIFATAPFLKVEFSEIPLLIFAVMVSPGVGICAQLVKDVLMLFAGSNIFGVTSDFIAGATFILVFTYIVGKAPNYRRIAIATVLGPAARMVVAIPLNLVILWLEFGRTPAQTMAMMPVLLPFNLIKSLLGAVCFALLYPQLRRIAPRLRPAPLPGADKKNEV
ncbi:ECF transporter S component [Clostridia bacterium OttesenSCG-928-O13]|nr:ECF transporter S component [Clostridia bacterium OttesenSCG-928-O13]